MSLDHDVVGADVLAETLGCSQYTLEELHRQRKLIGLRLGKEGLVYPREALLEQLNDMVRQQLKPDFDPAKPGKPARGYAVGHPRPDGPPQLID